MNVKLTRFVLGTSLLFASAPAAVTLAADAAKEVKLDDGQQKAVDTLRGKGAVVMQIAADTDTMAVNLSIVGKQATDADLELVKQLPKVVELDLQNTAVTDAGLSSLAGMTSLTRLHLEKTAVTDDGLKNLKDLAALTYLNLYGTAVTDAGLKHLEGLKDLQKLYLWNTKVTDAGAKELKAALPKLIINRGEELTVVPPPAPKEEKADSKKADPKKADDKKAGDKTEKAAVDPKPINEKCPVTGDPIDPTKTLVYEGKTIAFCCDKCPKAFEKEPAKYLVNLPNFKPAAKAAPSAAAKKKKGKAAPPLPAAAKAAPDIDSEGFIRTWLVYGPFPVDGALADAIDDAQLNNEGSLQPKEGDKAKIGDKEFAWKKAQAAEYNLDFKQALSPESDSGVGAYAVAYIESPEEVSDVSLLSGTNDEGKVYLNGKEVSKATESRSLTQDSEKATGLTLKKGTNTVVIKVFNESNNWEACVRLVDKDGKPIKGLKAKAAP